MKPEISVCCYVPEVVVNIVGGPYLGGAVSNGNFKTRSSLPKIRAPGQRLPAAGNKQYSRRCHLQEVSLTGRVTYRRCHLQEVSLT